jgi:hypothetical protein
MHGLSRSLLALCAVGFLLSCSKGNSTPVDAGPISCQSLVDCGVGQWVCINSICVAACHSSAECSAGLVCEEAVCLKPACGSDSQCGPAEACINGACASAPAASQVASC